MHLANFSAFFKFYTLLGCLNGALVNVIPELEPASVTHVYKESKNRLIVVHVDGIFRDNQHGQEEKNRFQQLLSKLAKDTKNEVCLISAGAVENLRGSYTETEGVRIVGHNGLTLYEPLRGRVISAEKLPTHKLEAIRREILEHIGKNCGEYKVKMGVLPLIIEPYPKSIEEGRNVWAALSNFRNALGTREYQGSESFHLFDRRLAVFFEKEDENDYPIKGLEEGVSGVFMGSQSALTPLPWDFGLSVGNEQAEALHNAMNQKHFFSVTVIQEENTQSDAKSRVHNIQQINTLLEKLANSVGIQPSHSCRRVRDEGSSESES